MKLDAKNEKVNVVGDVPQSTTLTLSNYFVCIELENHC